MILIIGSHQDDVLYCSSLLNAKSSETVLGRFPALKGNIFNQEVMIVHGVHTSLLAATVTENILSSNYVNLVFIVGKCFSLDRSYKRGDIIISTEMLDLDVDQIDVANATLGQVPGLPATYKVQKDVIGYVSDGFHKRTLTHPHLTTLLSSENLYSPVVRRALQTKLAHGYAGPFVLDSISFGVSVACTLHDVPCISVKAVERDLGETKSVEGYLGALDTYVDIGKAVVYTIGDIGRSDVLRVRRSS